MLSSPLQLVTHRLESSITAGGKGAVPTPHHAMTEITPPITTIGTAAVRPNPHRMITFTLPHENHQADHAVDINIPLVHRLHEERGGTDTMTVHPIVGVVTTVNIQPPHHWSGLTYIARVKGVGLVPEGSMTNAYQEESDLREFDHCLQYNTVRGTVIENSPDRIS